MHIKKLGTMICEVQDMNQAVAFYRDVLELKPALVSPGWSEFELGISKIGLHPPFRGSEHRSPGRGGWILGIEVEDLAKLHGLLKEAGAQTGGYHEVPSGVVLDFSDPDGNPLQAIQPGITLKDLA